MSRVPTDREILELVKKYLPGEKIQGRGVTPDSLRRILVKKGGLDPRDVYGPDWKVSSYPKVANSIEMVLGTPTFSQIVAYASSGLLEPLNYLDQFVNRVWYDKLRHSLKMGLLPPYNRHLIYYFFHPGYRMEDPLSRFLYDLTTGGKHKFEAYKPYLEWFLPRVLDYDVRTSKIGAIYVQAFNGAIESLTASYCRSSYLLPSLLTVPIPEDLEKRINPLPKLINGVIYRMKRGEPKAAQKILGYLTTLFERGINLKGYWDVSAASLTERLNNVEYLLEEVLPLYPNEVAERNLQELLNLTPN